MPSPSVTHTFTNGTAADASQVNTNFTDLINSLSDGTKDLSIAALTCAGTFTANGNVNLGNSSADDLTVTASLASDLPIKTTGTYNIGSSTKGLLRAYFGNASNSNTAGIVGGVTTSSYTMTLPVAAPAKGSVAVGLSSTALAFEAVGTNGKRLMADSAQTNGLKFAYGNTVSITSADSPYTVPVGVETVFADTTSGAIAITASAATGNMGQRLKIKKTAGAVTNAITVTRAGSETIGGATSKSLYTVDEVWEWESDDSNWITINHYANTPWTTFTGTGSWTSNTTYGCKYRRQGDTVEFNYALTLTGAPTSATLTLTLPFSWAIDTAKLTSAFTNITHLVGEGKIYDDSAASGANIFHAAVAYSGSTTTVAVLNLQTDDYSVTTQADPVTFASGDIVMVTFSVPISGLDA